MLIRHVPALRPKIRDKRQPELHRRQTGHRQQPLRRAKTRRFIPVQAQAGRRITKGRGRARVQVHRRLRAVTALQACRVRQAQVRAGRPAAVAVLPVRAAVHEGDNGFILLIIYVKSL